MIVVFLYLLAGIGSAYLFLSRQTWRLDGMDLMASSLVMFFWPLYILSILVMRHFNGDWR